MKIFQKCGKIFEKTMESSSAALLKNKYNIRIKKEEGINIKR